MLAFTLLTLAIWAMPGLPRKSSSCPFSKKFEPMEFDIRRAKQVANTSKKMGGTFEEQAEKINKHILKTAVTHKNCNDFDLDELNQIVRDMWCLMDPSLDEIYNAPTYQFNGGKPIVTKPHDLRRRRFQSLEEYEANWKIETKDNSEEVLRHAKCAEVLMLWTHHLNERARRNFNSTLPTMPTYKEEHAKGSNVYQNSYSCVTGHNITEGHTSDHKLPHWPTEVHYTATGHGVYPFWLGGPGPGRRSLDEVDIDLANPCDAASGSGFIEVWWSEPKAAEKFFHKSCSMTWAGYTKDVSCYHLMIGAYPNPQAYLYTEDESWCCISQPTSSGGSGLRAEKLTSVTSDFMDVMTLMSSGEQYKGTYYSGPVKKYYMRLPYSEPVNLFWYWTDMDDNPVQQGETPQPICHEYNQTSFKATQLDESVFAIPESCKSTTTYCTFP